MITLLVIAKEPRPGRVKTRLTPPFTPEEAATLAAASLADTLDVVARTPARRRVLVLEGEPGPWLPPGFEVVRQCAGGLDERLAAAFAGCDGPALLIGMDTPQVTPELLTVDFTDCDAFFGPAEDGGFWALGLAEPDPSRLRGVPMSTPHTGAAQRARLTDLRVRDLPRLRDVDTAYDADLVAKQAPGGRFATELARLTALRATPPGTARDTLAREARPSIRDAPARDTQPATPPTPDTRPAASTPPDERRAAGSAHDTTEHRADGTDPDTPARDTRPTTPPTPDTRPAASTPPGQQHSAGPARGTAGRR